MGKGSDTAKLSVCSYDRERFNILDILESALKKIERKPSRFVFQPGAFKDY